MEPMPVYRGHLNSEGDPQTELYVPQIIGDAWGRSEYGYARDFYKLKKI